MIKQLTKLSKLQKSDLRNIKTLVDRCGTHDQFKIKVYWHIIENRMTMEFNDLFYYVDGNLVGYLAIFTFESDEAEMTAVVHPKYRGKGIFKKLLQETLLEFHYRNIPSCVWIRPQKSPITAEQLQALGAQPIFSQMEMIAVRDPVPKELPAIHLKPANQQDLTMLAKLGAISFDASFTETLQRFTDNMRDKNRKAWLASSDDNENIGKIHVRFDENRTAFIHDLCILPDHQGRGLAAAMILKTMKMLRDNGQRTILLDVEGHNTGAVHLYKQCGFEERDAYDFVRVPVVNMAKIA